MRALIGADVVGGVFTWALELTAQLSGHGDQVELVTFGGRASPEQRARIDASGARNWHESELALEWMVEPWGDLERAAQRLLGLERALEPDIVHLSSFGHAAAGFRAPVVVTAHSDVWSWWRAVHDRQPPRGWNRYRTWVRDGLSRADAVIAPTATGLADLRRAYGEWPCPAAVIANGVTCSALHPPTLEREPVALGAGRLWDEAKNAGALAAAAARLPPGTVRIAGDPRGAPDLRPAVVLGPLTRDELAMQRRRAAVFAAPVLYEPFGLAPLEAALDGCALVLGDIPSQRELWDGVAWFVDPRNPEELADAIGELVGDAGLSGRWGRRARERALGLGDPEEFGRAHRHLYQELIDATAVTRR